MNSSASHAFLVIVSPSYGGAEKRFLDIFTALRRDGAPLRVIAPRSLLERWMADHPERDDVFAALQSIDVGEWNRARFVAKFRTLLRTLPRGARYHYPLNCLWMLHVGRGDTVSMTVADCVNVPAPLARKRTAALAWLAMQFSRRIDVLSPSILDAMHRYRARPRMSLTPGGTFLLPPSPSPQAEKRAKVVLLGRMVPLKGVFDWLDVLPDTWTRLRHRAPDGLEFVLAGYGELEAQVAARVATLAAQGIPVTFIGYAEAAPLLAGSALALSMQETTNFPSRVVAEALMAGCAALVRDTGDSRQFGELPGLAYCPAKLDGAALADAIACLVPRVLAEPGYPEQVRAAALQRFGSRAYLDYFRALMLGDGK